MLENFWACHNLDCDIGPRIMFFQIDLVVLLKSRSRQQIHFDSALVKNNLAARLLYLCDLG